MPERELPETMDWPLRPVNILSFLDSDDFFEPDMLEKAYEKGKRF